MSIAQAMGVKRRAAAASLSVFIVLLTLPLYIGVWNLLLSCLSINDSIERSPLSSGREQEDDVEEKHHSSTVQMEQRRNKSQKRRSRRKKGRMQSEELLLQQSPACNPNIRYSSETKKFKRLFFYHARKAGGTSLSYYFEKVAFHHGLIFKQGEGIQAEEPGTHKLPTFYVAHMREPIERSISHFKYEGRWGCHLLKRIYKREDRFTPTEENAKKLETWNATGGHQPYKCDDDSYFRLRTCAVNCFTQWFSGACPDMPIEDQYLAAKTRLLRYNFIIILDWLRDPEYAKAVENFFGVPGVTEQRSSGCEPYSHYANKMIPLSINNRTLDRLTELNEVDINLYQELTNCSVGNNEKKYNFPSFDVEIFDNSSGIQVHYSDYDEWKEKQKRLRRESAKKLEVAEIDESSHYQ